MSDNKTAMLKAAIVGNLHAVEVALSGESGRSYTYIFDSAQMSLEVGDYVVAPTRSGQMLVARVLKVFRRPKYFEGDLAKPLVCKVDLTAYNELLNRMEEADETVEARLEQMAIEAISKEFGILPKPSIVK